MKIAVPSDDKVHLAQHFGRTLGFLIFEVEGQNILSQNYQINSITGHVQGLHLEANHARGAGQHSHSAIMQALHGCTVVIAGGMGRRLLDDFARSGIEAIITQQVVARLAVETFLAGNLPHHADKACNHH